MVAGAALLAFAAAAPGAIVEKVNPAQDRVIVSLSQAELASLLEGQDVAIEISALAVVLPATIGKVNGAKRTAVVILPAPETRLARKLVLRFRAPYWNHGFEAPMVATPSHWQQFDRFTCEGGGGGFYENLKTQSTTDAGTTSVRSATTAWRLALGGMAPIGGTGYVAGMDLDHRDGHVTVTGDAAVTNDGRQNADLAVTALTPRLVVPLTYDGANLKLGLAYHYLLTNVAPTGSSTPQYGWTIGQPEVSLMVVAPRREWGLSYRLRDQASARTLITSATGANTSSVRTLTMPGEVWTFGRVQSAPFIGIGGGVGALIGATSGTPGASASALQGPATPAQILRTRVSIETLLESGDKFDWTVTYDGARTHGLSGYELGANEAGVSVSWMRRFSHELTLGVDGSLGAGVGSDAAAPGTSSKLTGMQVGLLLVGRYEADPLARTPRR